MCLLIASPGGRAVPFERIKTASENNPHGIGIAVADGADVRTRRMMTPKQAYRAVRTAEKRGLPYLLHFRYATHGTADKANCHPFRFGGGQFALAHNGIIHGVRRAPHESDTLGFVRFAAPAIEREGIESSVKWIESYVGRSNKIALIDSEGTIAIANELAGEWDGGVWYSNRTYEPQSWDVGGTPVATSPCQSIPELTADEYREFFRSELGYDIETEKDWNDFNRRYRSDYSYAWDSERCR